MRVRTVAPHCLELCRERAVLQLQQGRRMTSVRRSRTPDVLQVSTRPLDHHRLDQFGGRRSFERLPDARGGRPDRHLSARNAQPVVRGSACELQRVAWREGVVQAYLGSAVKSAHRRRSRLAPARRPLEGIIIIPTAIAASTAQNVDAVLTNGGKSSWLLDRGNRLIRTNAPFFGNSRGARAPMVPRYAAPRTRRRRAQTSACATALTWVG